MPTYLERYLEHTTKNEAPELFHVWCGYATIAATVTRKLWLPWGHGVIYPNIYVLLVGSAGCGKTTAIDKARRILALNDELIMSSSVETPEGLIRFMGGEPDRNPPLVSPCLKLIMRPDGTLGESHSILIVANEFIDFIRTKREDWTGMLNNIYDQDFYSYRTKGCGYDKLMGPCVNLLGAIPTEIQKQLQRQDIITSGFARRTIMQYGERKFHEPHAFPDMNPDAKNVEQGLHLTLLTMSKRTGPMTFGEESRIWWKRWYDHNSLTLYQKTSPTIHGWLSSKSMQVLKFAMLSSLSRSDDMDVKICDLELALHYLDRMESSLGYVFSGVGRNELSTVANKILEYITNYGRPVTRNALRVAFFQHLAGTKSELEMQECLNYLTAAGEIHVRVDPKTNDTLYFTLRKPDSVDQEVPSPDASAPPTGHLGTAPSTDPPL